MMGFYLGITLGKLIKKETQWITSPFYFRRNNLSLVSCSPAELTSVSIEHFKIQIFKLYLQSVEKSNHLHCHRLCNITIGCGISDEKTPHTHLGTNIAKLGQ